MTPTSVSKWQHVSDDLRRQITRGDLQVGDPMPTHNQLIDRYGVALGTVRMAVMQLQKEGLIWSRRGKGTFVSDPEKTRRRDLSTRKSTIGLLLGINTGSHAFSKHLNWLQTAVEAQGCEFAVRWCEPDQMDPAVERMREVDGLIIWGTPTSSQLERWATLGPAITFIGMTMDGQIPPTVSVIEFDVQNLVTPLAELALGMGHRKVSLVVYTKSAHNDQLGQYFLQVAREYGVAEQCRILLAPGANEAALAGELVAMDDPPTALLMENDTRACRLIHQLQGLGWLVPQRISVAAIGMLDPENLAIPTLTRNFTASHDILERALAAVTDHLQTGHPVHKQVIQRLRLGTTFQPLMPVMPGNPGSAISPLSS
jgi:DNA-binding LacI/PurR family transcriptional regulator